MAYSDDMYGRGGDSGNGGYEYSETYDPNKPKIKPVSGQQYDYQPNGGSGLRDPNAQVEIAYADPSQGQPQQQQAPQQQAPNAAAGGGDWQSTVQSLFGSLPPTSQSLDQIIAAIPGARRATHAGGTMQSDDAVVMPDGRTIDFIQNVGSPNAAWQQLDVSGGSGGSGGGQGGGGGFNSAPYVPGKGVAGQGTIFGAGGTTGSEQGNKLFDILMQRAGGTADVDPNDPRISRQVDAFGATQQRAERNYEQALAERKGPNSQMGAERRLGAEHIGQATSAFEANLMAREFDARRQEIQQALSGAMGFLSQSQQLQLQEELAQLQNAQQAYQFDSNDQFRNSPLGS